MVDRSSRGTARSGADATLALLVHQLDQAFDVRSWHGPNLMGSLRGLRGEILAWRPQPGRHNIAELAVHAAYWKYRVYRLISEAPPRAFDLPGSDFFQREGVPTAAQWNADLQLLKSWHVRLRNAVTSLDASSLADVPGRSEFTTAELISGAAAHDLYHAGQIRLLRRMYENR